MKQEMKKIETLSQWFPMAERFLESRNAVSECLENMGRHSDALVKDTVQVRLRNVRQQAADAAKLIEDRDKQLANLTEQLAKLKA